jgi:hypothetical protein
MSTELIIGGVAFALLALIAIAITIQTIEKNTKEKRRLETALKSRARNFQYLLEELPDGFLSKELQQLVCHSLIDVYEQLTQLQPKSNEFSHQLTRYKQQLAQVNALEHSPAPPTLTDLGQIKEIQQLLSSLFNFIAKLSGSKRINNQQAQFYAQQIRRVMLQTSLDGLNESANQAKHAGKLRLALHNYHMAIDKIKKENADGHFNRHLEAFQQRAEDVESQLSEHEVQTKAEQKERAERWNEMEKEDNAWKKKAMYD